MSRDVLADTLEALRLKGTAYFKARFRSPWGIQVPAREVAAFHVIVDGECYIRLSREPSMRLAKGDVVLFPHGAGHELVSAPDAETEPVEKLLLRAGRNSASTEHDRTSSTTTLVCGHFSYDRHGLHPFFATLPSVIHIRGADADHASWVATACELAAEESKSSQPGATVVVDRLAEALLIQTLRQFLARQDRVQGFLAAVSDSAVGRALACMHGEANRKWTVAELAHEAGMSRSRLAERFRRLVGESPMRYLARWRMLSARRLLTVPKLSTAEIAGRVGYESEFAFAKAFKRFFGHGPGVARRPSASAPDRR